MQSVENDQKPQRTYDEVIEVEGPSSQESPLIVRIDLGYGSFPGFEAKSEYRPALLACS